MNNGSEDFSYDLSMFHDIVLHGMLCARNVSRLVMPETDTFLVKSEEF